MEDNGDLVMKYREGAMTSADDCQLSCKEDYPNCEYWIFHTKQNLCILRSSEERKCDYWGGPKKPSFHDCRKMRLLGRTKKTIVSQMPKNALIGEDQKNHRFTNAEKCAYWGGPKKPSFHKCRKMRLLGRTKKTIVS